MTRSSLSLCQQVLSQISTRIQFAVAVFLLLACSGLTNHLFALQQTAVPGPKIWLGDNQALTVKPVGPTTLAQNVAAGKAQPLSMTAADVDGDGAMDMIAGFSGPNGGSLVIHRGNIDAFAPQSAASFRAISHGQFPSPFLPNAQVIDIPVRPDFVGVGNFTASGHLDLVVAARGGNSLLVLAGDGKGNFTQQQTVDLNGGVTALGTEKLTNGAFSNVVVGTATPQDASLVVFSGSQQGPVSVQTFTLSTAVSQIVFGDFADPNPDAAFLAGGDVFVLHSSTMEIEDLHLPVSASAIALGSFIYDRHGHIQIALLTSDGSIHIAAHSEFDPHTLSVDEMRTLHQAIRNGEPHPLLEQRGPAVNGWKIVESVPGVAQFSAGQLPQFFRTRISDHGSDDLMVINPSSGQLSVISHPDVMPDTPTFQPAQVSTRPYTGSPNAALPMRTNIDGRPGVVALHAGQLAPAVMMPLPDPTFTVNTTADGVNPGACAAATPNQCTLREAVIEANNTAGTDTIMVPAGTYILTLPKVANDCTAQHGALYINDSVNIVGGGQATTIIQAGSTATNGVDFVMAVNEDLGTANCPITNATASISNLTLKFGHNNGAHGIDGDGGCMEYDTGSSGNANLTLTNVTLDTCSTTKGNGGGIAIFNASAGATGGAGLATITNSIIQNNSPVDTTNGVAATAGGVWVSDLSRMLMSGSQVINNHATQVNNTGTVGGEGGGITITTQLANSRQTVIHGSTISGNHAGGNGGGIHDESNLVIDQLSVISNNSAGEANKTNEQSGGGLWINTGNNGCPAACTDTASLSKVTITGNTTTGNGGGLAIGNGTGAGPVTITFSRMAGNSAPTGTNLTNNHAIVTATDDWWGTNTPTNTIVDTGATTTSSPFIKMTHVASPATIKINTSTTLTADLSKDNNGSGTTLAGNLDVLNGVPVTFNNPVLGTIPQAQPEALNVNAQATATFNAGGTSGNGSADATVDQQTVTAPIVILEPLRIVKSFVPATVAVNATSALTFNVTNPNVIAVDANFTDTLPANLLVATPSVVTDTCGGTVTALAGATSVSFSNASLPVGPCTITVKVASAIDNIYSNSVTINSTAAGTGALSTSSANLNVINPPSITKQFGAATIPLNGTTSLTFTISSSNQNQTLNGISFTDTLPSGLVVATPSGLSTTCSGTATATAGSSSVSLSGASLAPGASCTVSVNVQGTTAGVKNNSVTVSDTVAGTGNTSNASITVVAPPTIAKAFGAASIPLNGSTSLSFTITNPNTTVALTGVAFSDTLPSGLVVSTPNGLTGTCGAGTITATAGSSTINLSGGTIAASASCTFSVNVTGTTAGAKSNTTGNVTSTEGGTGATSNTAVLHVEAPPSIAKVFTPSTIAVNATTSLTFTITNPAANVDPLTGVAFTDTLPTGLTVANATATVCGGTLTTTAPTGIALTGATVAVGGQCQFSVTVTGAVSGQYTNTTGNVTSTNGGTGNTATANLTVASPPTIAKAFGAASIPLNGTTSLTFTITNPNTGVALSGIAFTDNLPAGLVVATPNALNNTCGGTATATAGSGSVTLSAGTLAAGANCTVSVNVQGTTAGVKNNSVQVTSTEGGTGNTSNASITVVAPPTIAKAFGAASIPLNGSTSLSFTITNPNSVSLSGIAFSDTLPAGLIISTPNGLTGSCGGGTITATQGTNVISLSGATLAASASCTFSVNVTGITAGLQTNTTGAVTSTEGGTGGTATASINVVAPPSIAKVFTPSTIALNATTSLTFTITNPAANAVSLTGVAFTDTLPTGLTVANGTATVCGGTLTTTAPTGIALSGATVAVGGQCQFSVTVTGAASGQYTNTTGNVTSTNGGTGNTATANLTVASPPTIAKAFGAASIPLNGTTSLTFTITNPNTGVALSGVAFTDNLPAGLVVASTPNLTNTCGGTATAVGGASSVSLSAGTLAASANCTVSVTVQGTTAGVKNNSVQVTSTEGGTGNTSNASITVVGPPTIAKAFGAASIPLNGSTSLSFTITNANTVSLSGIAFSDTLPAGLVISTPNGLTGSCGGGTITATQNTNVISLSGATLAASASCTFSVNVTGIAAGLQTNTTGNVTSTEGGTGGTATASVNVVAPPSIAKIFTPSSIALNATTSLTFTITNPAANAVSLTGVAFTDTLPTGLTVANGTATVCGGTLTTTAPTGIALTGATIASGGQCQFSVTVTGAASGQYTNTTGAVTSTNGGTGNTATANLTVATPPTIAKAFGAASIPLNGTTSLTFSINNPNTNVALSGIAFTDNLPAGLVVASTPNLTNTCGGTATAVGGASSVSLSAGTLAASANCTVSVTVQGTTAGVKNNSVQVTSTEGGTGNTSNASITVVGPPTIAKAFGAASIPLNGSTSLSFTLANPNTVSLSGVAFSDTLPAGLVISTPNGLTGSCGGGTITATQNTNVISLSGATLAASANCTFSVNVTGIAAGLQTNTTGNVTSTEGGTGGTATASVNVVAPPSIAKAFNPSNIALNATTSLTFTITNPAANAVALTGVAFTDTLPTGLTVANGTATVCGGTLTTTAPTGIALSGATIATGGQCQFSVTVTGAAAGVYTNTTGAVTSTNGGTGNTATANLTVATAPTITKAFGAASILINTGTSLTFNIQNPNTSLGLTGIAFTDALPAGLQVSSPSGLTSSCGGTTTAAAGSASISLTGGTLAANASCSISVNVTGIAVGVDNNTTGAISSNESGAGNTSNTATITIIGPPAIAKAFGAASINLNATTTLTFTITNPNATVALAGVGFGDTLPAGLTVANPNGLTGSCGAGTITTGSVSGFSVVNLSGGTIAAGGSCTFSVNVVGTTGGHKVNTTGTVSSTNAGTGGTATATIDVEAPDPTITKTHVGQFHRGQTGAQYLITVSNVGFGPTVGTVTVVDTLPVIGNPHNIVPTDISGTGWTCTLATLTCTRADALASGSSYPVITMTVNIPQDIVNNFTNTADVSGGGDVNPNNNHASDPVSLGPPIVITPHFTSASIVPGSTAQFVFDLEDDDPALGPVNLGCSGLPVGSICSFNPASTTQAASQVVMTVTTSNGVSSASSTQNFSGPNSRLYAALTFPALGFVAIVFSGRKNKKNRKPRLRLAFAFAGLATLMALVGCGGGAQRTTTPGGTFTITVSAATTTVQATTQVNLTVQ